MKSPIIINKKLKELSIEELKKKENEMKMLAFLVVLFWIVIVKSFSFFMFMFLFLIWSNWNEFQAEIKSRENT